MTNEQQRLVRESWERIVPAAPGAAALFYERLFTIDPSLRSLFATADMTAQGAKLMDVITVAVHSLGRLERVTPALRVLGRRHAAEYGVRDTDYDTVGAALLWTLERGLGSFFTGAMREAWAAAYSALAGVMRAAAAEVATPAYPRALVTTPLIPS